MNIHTVCENNHRFLVIADDVRKLYKYRILEDKSYLSIISICGTKITILMFSHLKTRHCVIYTIVNLLSKSCEQRLITKEHIATHTKSSSVQYFMILAF